MKQYFQIQTGLRDKDATFFQKLFFRVSHPVFSVCIFAPIALLLLGLVVLFKDFRWYELWLGVASGFILWTILEYLLHRFVFHWTKVKEPFRTIFTGFHIAHHRDPNDKYLIVAPPVEGVLIAGLVFGLLVLVTQSWAIPSLMIAGVIAGYLPYEWIHFMSHQWQPRTALGKYLKHNHLYHHFKKPHEVFGVTNPFWDWVFKTPLKKVSNPSLA